MYRPKKSLSAGTLTLLFLIAPVLVSTTRIQSAHSSIKLVAASIGKTADQLLKAEAVSLYDSLRLKRFGLPVKAFEYAWKGYRILEEKGMLDNPDVLSICDYSQSSKRKRFYVIDLQEMKVLVHTYVAHGRNSGGEYARQFSNRPESHKSSLGFYVTGDTYYGEHGLSLKIEGLEKGINDRADVRRIVIHGSEYVGPQHLRSNRFTGRSHGCPVVPKKETPKVINAIRNGSCLFIYHPTKNYLTKSGILNS